MKMNMLGARLRIVLGFGVALILMCAVATSFGLAEWKSLPTATIATHETPKAITKEAHPKPADEYGALPLSFEANRGQTDASVQFVSHGAGYALFLTKSEAVIELRQQDAGTPALQKMKPAKRKLFESRKFYRGSPRSRKSRKTQTIRVAIAGAKSDPKIEAFEELPGKNNYFVGNDSTKWRTGIPTFGRVKYSGIYPGIDVVYYGQQRQLEFDFVVAPGADPREIGLRIQTGGRLALVKSGDLRVKSGGSSFELRHPEIYQLENGKKRFVAGRFVLRTDHLIGFQIGEYDHHQPLVIDPALAYSTYLGGNGSDDGFGIAVDSSSNAYIVGQTTSTNFPILNGYTSSANASGIAFISKLNPTGTALLYSTYLGGTGGEVGNGIALDPNGNVYVTGYTISTDFPVVNGFQTTTGTTDANAFVARIDTTQSGTASLVYSTYLGGGGNSTNPVGDVGYAIAADASGLAYVTGQTTSDTSFAPFPTTSSAYQSSLASQNGNAFLTVLDTNQAGSSSLLYSTYLGGSSAGFGDYGVAVSVDVTGDAYVTGTTTSGSPTPFPTTSSSYQASLNSTYGNAFVTEIATTQFGPASLAYSTYLGGSGDTTDESGDSGLGIALDSLGKVYVSGSASSSDFPVTSGAYQTTNPSDSRAFVSKLDLTQSGTPSLIYSTFLGGSVGDEARGIAVDVNGNAYVDGGTASTDFPTSTGAFQTALNGGLSAFFTELNSTGTALIYSTYLGGSCTDGDVGNGIALDSNGNPYVAGSTCSTDFPTYPSGAYQTSLGGAQNAFVTKFALVTDPGISASVSPSPDSSGWNNSTVTVTFTCVPGGAPLLSCSSPATVSTEGADQVISGNAVDTSTNTATATATVNLDLTAPVVSITSPTSGASVSTPYVAVSGPVTDALSGVGSVLCNGGPATVSGSTFSCTVPLNLVSNSITVTAFDLAGNSATATVSVSVSMATPTSLQITPGPATLRVGNHQRFTAIDQIGTRHPDTIWSVSDATIATLATDGSGTLTGVAAGEVTLTATIGSVSGETEVTVSGSSLTAGTILWSAPAVSGYVAQQIVQAVPTVNGPDLYSIETDSSSDVLVRAFTSDGRQLWQSSVISTFYGPIGAGDNSGGLLLAGSTTTASQIIDINPQTGGQTWQYSPAPVSGVTPTLSGNLAVGLDGTVYVVEGSCSYTATSDGYTQTACLNGISGTNGALVSQATLPNSSATDITGSNCDTSPSTYVANSPGNFSSPVIAPDGSVYMEMETSQSTGDLECNEHGSSYTYTYSESFSLLKNGAQVQTLNSHTGSGYDTPGGVIPDGNGGMLAAFVDSSGAGLTIVDTAGARNTFSNIGYFGGMVLGDNNTAFVTDGSNLTAFNATTVDQDWTYATTGGTLSFINATNGGGVAINDSELGAIQLDSTGSPSSAVASLLSSVPLDLYSWQNITYGELAMMWDPDGANGIRSQLPRSSSSPSKVGNPEGQSAPPFCQVHQCALAPTADTPVANRPPRNITYGVYSFSNKTLTPLYGKGNPFEIVLEEQFTSQNTDTSAIICLSGNSNCNNRLYTPAGDDYLSGEYTDQLVEPHSGLTIAVTQHFSVSRQPVHVFWPVNIYRNGSPWTGAKSLTAVTTTSTAKVYVNSPDQEATACQPGPTGNAGCDKTAP
jgi:hypothetical protein